MARSRSPDADSPLATSGHHRRDPRLKELGLSCMLNTEVAAVLAVIRRPLTDPSTTPGFSPADVDGPHSLLVHSLKSLRSLIFHPNHSEWRTTDPAIYLSPFLDVVQSDDIPAAATGVALSSVLKILRLDVFDDRTPGARDAIHSVVFAVTNCRLESAGDPAAEEAVLARILQVLVALLRTRASPLLTDHAVCTIVNTCFQVVQQAASRGDLLQRSARHAMHEIIQAIYGRLPDITPPDGEEHEEEVVPSVYGARCMGDIFRFLCSLLNVGEVVEQSPEVGGVAAVSYDEDLQLFSLVLINSAVEFGGEAIGRHSRLLGLIKDDLLHHLIHYASSSSPLVLSMICSTVLNIYHFLRQ